MDKSDTDISIKSIETNESLLRYKKHIEKLKINNSWNTQIEINVSKIGEKAAVYKWLHEKSACSYIKIDSWLTTFIIILSGLTGTGNLLTIIFWTENRITLVLSALIIYVLGVIAGYQKATDPKIKAMGHLNIAVSFSSITHDVQNELALNRVNRQNGPNFASWIKDKYETLLNYQPPIKQNIINDLKQKFKDSSVAMPDITDVLENINVNDETFEINQNTNEIKNISDKRKKYIDRINRRVQNNLISQSPDENIISDSDEDEEETQIFNNNNHKVLRPTLNEMYELNRFYNVTKI